MELGPALKYFFSKAKITINYKLINVNLLSYFPLLKNGYAKLDTIKNVFNLYIKINKLNEENKVIVDNLFIEAFNGTIPITNYYLVGNKYSSLIHLYKYIIKYREFSNVDLLTELDLINCPEPLKLEYSNLIKTITEYNLLQSKDSLSVKEIFIKNYKEYNIEINTFNFLKSCNENFNYNILETYIIGDIINLNIIKFREKLEIDDNLEKELKLSNELIKIMRLIEQDNVIEAATIRNNNTITKIIKYNFNDLILILKIAKYHDIKYVLENILSDNYFKLLNSVIWDNYDDIYKYLYELNVDPRYYQNNLYLLSKSDKIKELIKDVSFKKNLLQKELIINKIEDLVGPGYGDLANTINDYINNFI